MTNILSAKELMAKIAKVEGEKASKAMKAHEAAEAEKQRCSTGCPGPPACRTTRSWKRRQSSSTARSRTA